MTWLLTVLSEQNGLSHPDDFRIAFRRAAKALGDELDDPQIRYLDVHKKTISRWLKEQVRPQNLPRLVVARMFDRNIDELLSEARPGASSSGRVLTPERDDFGPELFDMRGAAQMAARRSMEFALSKEAGEVGETTMGLLQDQLKRIINNYHRLPLSSVLHDLVSTQDEVFRLLEGKRARPTQLKELNVMATLLTWFMAKASSDMGDPDSAMMQARTAGLCAKDAEHSGLIALVDGLKSLIAYWSDKPADALHYARHGAVAASNLRGTVAVWLSSLESRAAALMGDAEAARKASLLAIRQRERVVPDDLDALGGLLTFPEAKQLYYGVETEVLLRNGTAVTTFQAEEAVRAFSDASTDHWAFGDQAGAECNLALVRLYAGDFDGAADAMRPVLDLQPLMRNRGIVVSARRVRHALGTGGTRDAVVARDLRDEIEAYEPHRLALPR